MLDMITITFNRHFHFKKSWSFYTKASNIHLIFCQLKFYIDWKDCKTFLIQLLEIVGMNLPYAIVSFLSAILNYDAILKSKKRRIT